MPDQIPEPVKTARSDELLSLERKLSLKYRKSFLGRSRDVLLEEKTVIGGREYMIGHTKEYVKAVVPYADGLKNTVVEGTLSGMITDEIMELSGETSFADFTPLEPGKTARDTLRFLLGPRAY